jgi:glycine/D-amino acid oxidase-like deaminating enzyme
MDLRSELPYWTVRNGLLGVYPPLESDVRCDVLIVGGGISGALLAHQLVKRGVECALIDKRDIGSGSTSASTALLQYEIDTPLYKLRQQVGAYAAERAYSLGIDAIHQLQHLAGKDTGFALRPSLQIATRMSEVAALKKEYEARHKLKFPVTILGRLELRGSGIEGAAALRSSIAGEVDPYRLTHRLLQLASSNGLRVFDRTAGSGYAHSRSHVTVKTDRGPKVKCRAVFFATGYETIDFLPARIVNFKSTYAFASEPLPDLHWWKDRSLIWGIGDPYPYMRTSRDNRVIVGGEDDGVLNPQRRDRQIGRKTIALARRFNAFFPGRRIEPAFGWAGAFGSTKDGLAYMGRHPSFPRAYFALGFGGNGITFSQIAARILVDMFLERENRDAKIFQFDR